MTSHTTGTASRNRKLRRGLILWSLPFTLLTGLFSLVLVAQHVIAERAVTQYLAEEYEEALNSSGQLTLVNVVERWKPFYNLGTSYLQLEALPEAQEQLASAMGLATPEQQCPIRANYAIAIEREGDLRLSAGDAAGARERWQAALALLEERHESCATSTSDRSLSESEERIREKLADESEPDSDSDGSEQPTPDPDSQPNPDSLEELEDGLDGNREDRQDEIDRQEHGSGGDRVDQPW